MFGVSLLCHCRLLRTFLSLDSAFALSGSTTSTAGALGSLFTQCRPRALRQMRNGTLACCGICRFLDIATGCSALSHCCHNSSSPRERKLLSSSSHSEHRIADMYVVCELMNFVLQIKVAPVLTTGAIPAESWCSRRVETVAAMWGFHHCRKLPAGSIMFHPRKCASPPGCQNAALPLTPTKHLRVAPLITDSRETPVRKVCSSFVQERFHRENPVTRPGFVRSASRGPVRNCQTRPSKFPGSRSCGLQKECPTKDGLSVASGLD
jgi:hypothetical protein